MFAFLFRFVCCTGCISRLYNKFRCHLQVANELQEYPEAGYHWHIYFCAWIWYIFVQLQSTPLCWHISRILHSVSFKLWSILQFPCPIASLSLELKKTKLFNPTPKIRSKNVVFYAIFSESQESVNLTAACNSNCNCDISSYEPVCHTSDVLYFSPCHAGCLNSSNDQVKLNQTIKMSQ